MAKLAVCAAVLLVLLVALSESSPMRFCCTQYQETQVPVKMLKSYRIQDNTGYCNIKAVVFRTKRNKNVCGNPDDEWVQKAKELIPRRH
ncbi:C-C motif chemokine 16-like [Stegastes partitus]|uniref:C-C motif chemokine 16-like n=1 Tax=Stegastes partitus TaxID=144197 RepID=A0A9Y4MTB7_9TELE|nr:PREDICTED: C-C motif chemokine 16-like [Stegastes partitus]